MSATLVAPLLTPDSRREAVKRHLRERVLSGQLPPGRRIPSIRELTSTLGVGKNTVIAALDALCGEGLLEPRERSGFFVKRAPVRRASALRVAELRRDRLEHGLASVLAASSTEGFQSLGGGCPPSTMLASREWTAALRTSPAREPTAALGYMEPLGDPHLRELVAREVSGEAAGGGGALTPVDPGRVLITHGASEALHLALAEAAAATGCRRVALESPGYYLLWPLVRHLGLEPVPVPRTPEGLDLQLLEREAKRGGLAAVVTVPNHHNPLGTTLPLAQRFELAALAGREGFFLVEDDVYRGLWLDGEEPPALRALLPERTLYVGSFSKTLGPALRLGYLVAPQALAHPLRSRKFILNMGEDTRTQRLVAGFLESRGYPRHLEHLRGELSRRARLAQVQARAFADLGAFDGPYRGGYFLRFRFREGVDVLSLYDRAKERKLLIAPGAFFHEEAHDTADSAWMRVCVAQVDGQLLPGALKVLRELAG
jgi:DNA-binding transcriptional MocR family regulator